MKNYLKLWACLLLVAYPALIISKEWKVAPRVAYMYPTSENVRKIYGTGMPFYQLDVSYAFSNCWSAFVGAGYACKNGHSIGLHENTNLKVLLGELGVRFKHKFNCGLQPWIGLGATYSHLRIHNSSDFVKRHVDKNAFGGIAELGLSYVFCNGWSVDIFTDYIYTKYHFAKKHHEPQLNDVDLSNFLFGVGLSIPLGFCR